MLAQYAIIAFQCTVCDQKTQITSYLIPNFYKLRALKGYLFFMCCYFNINMHRKKNFTVKKKKKKKNPHYINVSTVCYSQYRCRLSTIITWSCVCTIDVFRNNNCLALVYFLVFFLFFFLNTCVGAVILCPQYTFLRSNISIFV